MEKLKINMIKTDKGCFISDCDATDGYDYEYHRSKIKDLYFDEKLPTATFYPNWYKVTKYPKEIKEKTYESYNTRYEIKNENLISNKLPKIIKYSDMGNYDSDVLDNLYNYEYDKKEVFKSIDFEISTICEVNNFEDPIDFDYKAIQKKDFSDSIYHITNTNIKHQLLDKMIFPEILLPNRPCKLTSKQVYDITRQYIKENIDSSKARITSDYDFCFDVKKIIPLIEPETISYHNLFARTKKQRAKTHYCTKENKEIPIFSMTHNQENYEGYTAIDEIYANSEKELKEKVDKWLKTLISIINKPLNLCPHCHGTGYQDNIESVNENEIINNINNK